MIFALYHSLTETVGLLEEVMKERGVPFRDVHLYAGDGLPRDISDLRGLIVMGGPMNVDDVVEYPFLQHEVQLLEKVLSSGRPVLGICLGAQLIAKALGCKVYKNSEKEIGWHPITLTNEGTRDPLFQNIPEELSVLHWHGDTFDLPKGAVHLARSTRCENQAYRWGSNVYGFQFHLEATPAMVRSWVRSEEGKADLADSKEDGNRIITETAKAFPRLRPHATGIFSSYLDLAYSSAASV